MPALDDAVAHLRPLVQSITLNLPRPVRDIGLSLLGETCYRVLLLQVDPLSSPDCVRLAVSKSLGLGIVAASSVVKVPQLIKLVRSGSPAGVSVLAYALETASYLVSLAYNVRSGFPFSTYGETALIAVQNVAITALVLRLGGQTSVAAVFVAVLAVAGAALMSEDVVGARTLGVLQAGAGVVGVASKVPQIAAIWREGSTGQLSAFTVFNYLLGSLTRIFTTLQEVDDKLILYGFVAGFMLNAVLAAQMVYYWNAPAGTASVAKRVRIKTREKERDIKERDIKERDTKEKEKETKEKDTKEKTRSSRSKKEAPVGDAMAKTSKSSSERSSTPLGKRNGPTTRRRG